MQYLCVLIRRTFNLIEMQKLYHYTSSKRFDSIISSNVMLYSNTNNSNDNMERYATISNYIDINNEKYICLSKDYKNSPLWYFYANRFNGVCIELDFNYERFTLVDIEYINPEDGISARRRLNSFELSPRDYLSRKVWYWRYEDEVRLFDNQIEDPNGIVNIHNYINNVYIGGAFDYNVISDNTALFLYQKFKLNQLKGISSPNGYIESSLDYKSPKLFELFIKRGLLGT